MKCDRSFRGVLDIDLLPITPGMDPGVQCHGIKIDPPGYLWSKFEGFRTSGCPDMSS